MARKHHYRRKTREAPELEITAFLNLMVVLVPFLLITAVFSRITIMELNVPSTATGDGQTDPLELVLEVIVREGELQIDHGDGVATSFVKVDDEYDISSLSKYLQEFKQIYPEKTDASVLMEANIEYEYLIQIMDALRGAEVQKTDPDNPEIDADASVEKIVLFPDISVGDAPPDISVGEEP